MNARGTTVISPSTGGLTESPQEQRIAPVRFAAMFHPAGSDLTMAEAKRSRINAFGIADEGKTGLSTSEFSWAA